MPVYWSLSREPEGESVVVMRALKSCRGLLNGLAKGDIFYANAMESRCLVRDRVAMVAPLTSWERL